MTAETSASPSPESKDHWLDKTVVSWWPSLTIEKLLIILIITLTIITRFYDLGARTMSHDEVNHVVPSYTIETYVYDPVTHGPFQFHAIALSYFIFGDSDFSARIPAAVFGVAVVVFTLFAWRRYLGRVGALIGGFLFMISPYILFYSRYTRNEIFIVFWGLVMLWLFLRYLEGGEVKFLYWLTFITAMHYSDKATSYIFTAEALIFLVLLFIAEVLKKRWKDQQTQKTFTAAVGATLLSGVLAVCFYMLFGQNSTTAETGIQTASLTSNLPFMITAIIMVVAAITAIVFLVKGVGMQQIRRMRSFDLIVLQLLLVLPLLTALPINLLGFDPLDYSQAGIIRSVLVFSFLGLISMLLGMMWNRKVWLRCAVIFWGIFIVFYTTFFTHGEGFFKGLVAALGYWMSQQEVQRGTQPLYYYAFVQIPMYEYLPALGSIVTLIIAAARGLFTNKPENPFVSPIKPALQTHDQTVESTKEQSENYILTASDNLAEWLNTPENQSQAVMAEGVISGQPLYTEAVNSSEEPDAEVPAEVEKLPWHKRLFTEPPQDTTRASSIPTVILLLYWSLISLLAFSFAGERMPWLTTHIAMPMILAAAWGLGYLVEKTNWQEIRQKKGALVLLLIVIFLFSFGNLIGSLAGATPPFQGQELVQLQATSTFLLALVGVLGSTAGLVHFLKGWTGKTFTKLVVLSGFTILSMFTFRTAYRAAYINYDNAKEFLVYAHSTRDMKDVLEQIETISKRLYGDKSIAVAYDNDTLYPFWWYLRDYPNRHWYGDTITKDLKDCPIILVGTKNYAKIEPLVGDDYYMYEYKRMWWPMESYRNQTLGTVWEMVKQPAMRSALWQIWFNRDYTEYAALTGNSSLTLATWSPSDTMRMYIRKDVAAQIWEYGITPEPETPKVDPYAGNTISLDPVRVISVAGDSTFLSPRGIAAAADGSLYVADSRNHRIVHLDQTGLFINAWGSYANVLDGTAPQGTFNEPWGVAVGSDGLVYVADTWNHRIQVFTPDGEFVRMWSEFQVSGVVDSFWGPRGIAVDADGRVYVTDTGKQRVVVFDSQGNYLTQFGGLGMSAGQLDEPVGIALDDLGRIYVADTWNNRVQVFEPNADYTLYTSVLTWQVDAWNTDTLDNKPFIALNSDNQIFITDPDLGRIIRFDQQGNFLQLWGGYDNSYLMGVISGIAISQNGEIWVSDALNNTLLVFTPPAAP
ncbi:MAG: glycosyltransferase family 39 protein [Anaerolineaceae bacterium]